MAPMNSMASLIDGITLHKFGRLSGDLHVGCHSGGKRDMARRPNTLYSDLQCMRWVHAART